MSDDAPLKSAYELAMERLRDRDREQGLEQTAPLTDEQKEAIAELRRKAEAKLAELQILHRKDRSSAMADPEHLTKLEEEYETDRRRAQSSLESAIARVRRGEEPEEQ